MQHDRIDFADLASRCETACILMAIELDDDQLKVLRCINRDTFHAGVDRARMTHRYLMETTGFTREKLYRALESLSDLGLIRRERPDAATAASTYGICFFALIEAAEPARKRLWDLLVMEQRATHLSEGTH